MMSSSKTNNATLYPAHFVKGARIQLGNGEIKAVEELTEEDFQNSTSLSSDLKLDSSLLVKIEIFEATKKAFLCCLVGSEKITIEAPLEHPFFVYHKGWCSVDPQLSLQRYKLSCKHLAVGDRCASLTLKEN